MKIGLVLPLYGFIDGPIITSNYMVMRPSRKKSHVAMAKTVNVYCTLYIFFCHENKLPLFVKNTINVALLYKLLITLLDRDLWYVSYY